MGENKYLGEEGLVALKAHLLDELHITSTANKKLDFQVKEYVTARMNAGKYPRKFKVVCDVVVPAEQSWGNQTFEAGDSFDVMYAGSLSERVYASALIKVADTSMMLLSLSFNTQSGSTTTYSRQVPVDTDGFSTADISKYDYIDNFNDFIDWLKETTTYPSQRDYYVAQLYACPIEGEDGTPYSGMLVGAFFSSGGPYVFTGHLIGNGLDGGNEGFGTPGKEYNVIIAGSWWDSGDLADGYYVKISEVLTPETGATYFLASPATFVVNSDETLAAWAAHTAGNDYSSVYIASGTYTLPSGGINLTAAGTKQVEGHPSSKLVFEALTPVDGNYSAALYYTSRPTDPTYNIKNVNVECTGAPATSANNYPCAFKNCVDLTNCSGYAKATGTKAYQAAYAFYGCQNLSFCFGASSGANNGNAYTFAASSYLTNCTADETAYPAAYDSKADIIPYASCSYLVNCVSKAKNGYELTRGFFGCSYLTGCHAEMTQDASTTVTEISGFNRCSRISNCRATITDNSGKTLTNIGGFINSTMIDNCTSEGGQIYNSSYVAKCNATAYTQSYSDNYVTAADDTAAGGWNHTGILTWKNNRWENA